MSNSNFIPSEEQKAIFEFIEHGIGDAVVNACAGSGKSTTILEGIGYVAPTKSLLFISFNKAIVDELNKKVKEKYPNRTGKVHIMTFHGLGYRMYADHFGTLPTINESKYTEYVHKNILAIAGFGFLSLSGAQQLIYKKNIRSLVDFSRLNMCQNEREVLKISKKYSIPLVANEVEAVVNILKWGSVTTDVVDFLDLVWYPNELNYFSKKYMSDFIFIDEAQDTSPVQQALIKRCFKRETRTIAVGDKYQTINAWCGSDQEAFEHIKYMREGRTAKEFALSTSYRCPKKLVEMASKIAPNIKAADWAIEGEFNIGASLDNVQPGDMILCRNSAPLIKLHRRLTKSGKPSYIKNVELGETFEDIIKLTKCETIECLLESLEKHIVDVWKTIAKALNCELKECVSEQRIVNLFDVYKIIEEMSESVENVSELSNYLKGALSYTDKENAISLSTIHRAKGLEADNVYVICPSIIPSPLAKKDWEKEAEKYLEYVMLTRAKKSLNMVDEATIRAGQWVSNEAIMYSELKKLKDKIEMAG